MPIVDYLPKPLKALAIRFDKSPFVFIEQLREFNQTRASYVAQTALFGYLKARMGTKHRVLFEDEVFSKAIQDAAANLFGTCLADLTFYSVALLIERENLSLEDAPNLAKHLFKASLSKGLEEGDFAKIERAARKRFNERLDVINWHAMQNVYTCFNQSEKDLVLFAPVTEEFKESDREIVQNSIRFRWQDVRAQLRKRLDAPAVLDDWAHSR